MSDKNGQRNVDKVCDEITEKLRALRVPVVTIGRGKDEELFVYHRAAKIPDTAPGADGKKVGKDAKGRGGFKVVYERIGAVIPGAIEGTSKARLNRAAKASS